MNVTAKVVEDSSDIATEIIIILTNKGVLESVTDYVLSLHLNGISRSTIYKHIQPTILLIKFMEANKSSYSVHLLGDCVAEQLALTDLISQGFTEFS